LSRPGEDEFIEGQVFYHGSEQAPHFLSMGDIAQEWFLVLPRLRNATSGSVFAGTTVCTSWP